MPRQRQIPLLVITAVALLAAFLLLTAQKQTPAPPDDGFIPATSLTAVISVQKLTPAVVWEMPTPTPLPPGQAAPSFTLVGLDGELHRLQDFRGKRVVLNFWASWCGPCRVEMPILQAAYDELKNGGGTVIGINMAEDESRIRSFTDELRITFPIFLDAESTAATAYRVAGLPTTFFIDTKGMIRATHIGPLTEETLQQHLDQLEGTGQ